jgi:hypothetical protein
VNDFVRWDANDTITEGQERIFEIEQEQIEIVGDSANPADYESVNSSTLSDEDKEAWVHLQAEKRRIEADMAQAQEALDEIEESDQTGKNKEVVGCNDPSVFAEAQSGFEEYRRQIDHLAAQCRRELDQSRVEPVPAQEQRGHAGSCDLEALEADLTNTVDNLSNPDIQEQLARSADEYRLDRQMAWNNLSCAEACVESGGTCTLDKDNKQICVPAWQFYGGDYAEAIDDMISGNENEDFAYEPFSMDDSLQKATKCSGVLCPAQ